MTLDTSVKTIDWDGDEVWDIDIICVYAYNIYILSVYIYKVYRVN